MNEIDNEDLQKSKNNLMAIMSNKFAMENNAGPGLKRAPTIVIIITL